jgi:hypothetical protein
LGVRREPKAEQRSALRNADFQVGFVLPTSRELQQHSWVRAEVMLDSGLGVRREPKAEQRSALRNADFQVGFALPTSRELQPTHAE